MAMADANMPVPGTSNALLATVCFGGRPRFCVFFFPVLPVFEIGVFAIVFTPSLSSGQKMTNAYSIAPFVKKNKIIKKALKIFSAFSPESRQKILVSE
jgi:hypothetical protein